MREKPIGDPDFFRRVICLDVFYKLTDKKFRDRFEPDEYYEYFENLKDYFYPLIKYYHQDPYLIILLNVDDDFDFDSLLTFD
jgi:hypothetical protein